MESNVSGEFAVLTDCRELTVRRVIDDGAAAHPDRVFAVFPETGVELTWAQLREGARRLAVHLASIGVAPGATVGLLAGNGRLALEVFLGCMYGGFTTVTFNPVAGQNTLRYVLGHSEVSILFTDEANLEAAHSARDQDLPEVAVLCASTDQGLDLPSAGSAELAAPAPQDDALLIYTSGTTGRPKGVIHSHTSLLAGGANTVSAHHLCPQDRALCVLPLCHINGQVVTVIAPLLSGSSVVMPHQFRVSQFWNWVTANQCTWFSAVPTIISYLLGLDATGGPAHEELASVRFGRSASAPLPPAVHEAFVARFGIPLVETMGITETAAQILSNPLDHEAHRIGSPGKSCGNQVRIANGDIAVDGTHVEAEIQVRGPNLMCGYSKDPEATATAFTTDGWYRTGDLGYMDDEGFIFVTGRIKELIIKGGENISPREIDDVIYQFPGVLEAAAIGVPDTRYGEEVAACVVPSPGASIVPEALRRHCEEKLGVFKTPKVFHVMNTLPKGPSGKIQRLKLADAIGEPDTGAV